MHGVGAHLQHRAAEELDGVDPPVYPFEVGAADQVTLIYPFPGLAGLVAIDGGAVGQDFFKIASPPVELPNGARVFASATGWSFCVFSFQRAQIGLIWSSQAPARPLNPTIKLPGSQSTRLVVPPFPRCTVRPAFRPAVRRSGEQKQTDKTEPDRRRAENTGE